MNLMVMACALSTSACYQSAAKTEINKILYDKKAARWGAIRSAEFYETATGKNLKGSCGHVNSKNRYGAYTGPTAFIYTVKSNGEKVILFYDGTDDAQFTRIWYESCHGMKI